MILKSILLQGQRLKANGIWPLISILMLLSVAYFSPQQRLIEFNHLIQDFVVAHHPRPLTGDIVIVAIDDKSIEQIGRWPWRRNLHATLLGKINADKRVNTKPYNNERNATCDLIG